MNRFFVLVILATATLAVFAPAARAQPELLEELSGNLDGRELPEWVSGLRLSSALQVQDVSRQDLGLTTSPLNGPRQVVIHLQTDPVAKLSSANAETQQTHRLRIEAEQQQLLNRLNNVAAEVKGLARVQLVLNAVIAEVDAEALPYILEDPHVSHISPVIDYELALSETVPYIGASEVHDLGVDGSGVRVAVIDTGIDYTHFNLGGPGTLDAFDAAYGGDPSDPRNTTTDDLFPTAKVVGGFDFLGEFWPAGPLAPDPDPIDFNGHGTHVADIIGGRKGVAPGVEFYALKVCAALAGGCSGVALIQAMEFAVDPNGDGNTQDHVDIVNMSLGGGYGQPFDDALSTAVDNATKLGVLTVAAAGNGGDRPYITGTPAAAATAISVAQTQMPSAFLPSISVIEPAAFKGEYRAVFQPWSAPLNRGIQGLVQYGNGAGGNLNGCTPFGEGSLEGKIVVVDRGACFFSSKIRHIQVGGGDLGIIARVDPGTPFPGGVGGGSPIPIPAYMVSMSDGDILRRGDAVIAMAPGQGISLAGSVVDTSSRGPEFQSNHIKPELSAPGASMSAASRTGTGERSFGGTSGATPMVAGAAALLVQGHLRDLKISPEIDGLDRRAKLTPLEVKARLMNTAEVNLRNSSVGNPAPVSRVGGGEVRIDRAIATQAAAWDTSQPSGALSFGFLDVADQKVSITKGVHLQNYSRQQITYQLGFSHQFADDAATDAVTLALPDTVSVEGGMDVEFEVTLHIDGTKLRDNLMNSGPQGNDPAPLTANEYDGYIILDDGKRPIRLAWHVLPRKAARLVMAGESQHASNALLSAVTPLNSMELNNTGVGTAQNKAYSLLATSPRLQRGGRGEGAPTPDLRAIGIRTFDAPAGFCSANSSYILVFAINTWERQTHANWPGFFMLELDTDQDGTTDYTVFNGDSGLQMGTSEGRNMTWVHDNQSRDMSALFFTEHAMNTANTVLYVCADQIGKPNPHQQIDLVVAALDGYFGGPGDLIPGLTFFPSKVGFLAPPAKDIPAGGTNVVKVNQLVNIGETANETGLLIFTNGDRGPFSRGAATADTEALVFMPPELARSPSTPSALEDTGIAPARP